MSEKSQKNQVPIRLSIRRIVIWGVFILLFLNLGNALAIWSLHVARLNFAMGIIPLFGFDREANFPTMVNAGWLQLSGFLAFVIARSNPDPGRARRWLGIALILWFLSVDELCMLHDNVSLVLHERFSTDGLLAWPWVIVYGVLTLSVAAFYLRFFFTLDRKLQIGLGVAAVLYVGGAIGMEMIAAQHLGNDAEDVRYAIYYTIEENLEIIASMLTAIVLMRFLRERETKFLGYVEPSRSEGTRLKS